MSAILLILYGLVIKKCTPTSQFITVWFTLLSISDYVVNSASIVPKIEVLLDA